MRGLRLAPFAISLTLAACAPSKDGAGGGDDDDTKGDPGGGGPIGASCVLTAQCSSGATLAGKVFAPNGTDPIAGATVYVPTTINEFPQQVACEVCSSPVDPACARVFTDADGSFQLSGVPVKPGGIDIVVQKGRFRKVLHLEPTCGMNDLPASVTSLPGAPGPGADLPRIAVASGDFDAMECVLDKMGLQPGSFDIFDGQAGGGQFCLDSTDCTGGATCNPSTFQCSGGTTGPNTLGGLLQDGARLKQYNILFLNCTGDQFEDLLSNATVAQNIESYVASGGRLYVTDWSYDYIEQVPQFSPFIDFEPGPSGAATPEAANAAALGADGLTVEADVLDPTLADWLKNFPGAYDAAANTVHIEHFLIDWVMQNTLSDDAKGWVQGNVRSQDGQISGMRPLTVTFDYNACGKVLYSSYHTAGDAADGLTQFPGYCSSTPLTPQERILEFLILEISDCVNIN